MDQNRVPTGVPTGGQFSPTTRADSDVHLGAAETNEPQSLAALVDTLDGDPLVIEEHEFSGRYGFERVEVTSDGNNGFEVQASVDRDLSEDLAVYLCAARGEDPHTDQFETTEREAAAWLDANDHLVSRRLHERYSASMAFNPDGQVPTHRFAARTRLGPNSTSADVLDACAATRAGAMAEDLASGTFFVGLIGESQPEDEQLGDH